MKDNKKYYYIKLEDSYFGSKFQKALRKMSNGAMTIVYLKMQLKYARSNGYIKYDGVYPSIEEEIAAEIDESTEDVRMTLAFLKQFEFVKQVDSVEYCIIEMQERIGTISDAAIRKAKSREQIKLFSEQVLLEEKAKV